jgi:hypothetical protein
MMGDRRNNLVGNKKENFELERQEKGSVSFRLQLI